MGKYFAAQECVVEMYIYLGGSDAFVSQHLLYSPQVGSAFEQVGGEAVAQSVGADVFLNAAGFALFFDNVEYHDPAQPSSPTVEKENVFIAFLGGDVASVFLIKFYFVQVVLRDGYKALFAAFALDDDIFVFKLYLGDTQPYEFRYPQAAIVHRFYDSPVALALGQGHIE